MSYCTNCGAYIPDGETKCVSCGEDVFMMQAPKHPDAGSAFAQSAQSKAAATAAATDELRQTLEQKQREQQEKTKQWAENAYADHKAHQAHKTSENTGGTPSAEIRPDEKASRSKSKLLAGLSYLSILWILPFFFTSKSDDFARFHAKQGAILFVAGALIDLVSEISGFVGLVLWLLRLYLIYKGIRNVVEEKMEYLPWIGQIAEKF